MNKRETFVELELTGKKLDCLVAAIRDRLLSEFWAHIPDGEYREQIKTRLENNILSAFNHELDDVEAT